MSTGSYNERRGRRQRHYGGWVMVFVSVLVLLAFVGQSAYAQVTPPPGTVTINNAQFIGTGCQPNTFTNNISEARLTLSYSGYTAEDGVSIAPLEARKNCNIILDITSVGYRLGIISIDFKGFADLLDANTIGTLVAQYFFQGQSPQVEFVRQQAGPLFDNYELRDQKITTEVMFGPCGGGALNINTEVRVQGTGAMLTDTTTGLFQQIYTLVWQSC